MDYKQDVAEDAFDFLSEIEEDIKDAIVSGEEEVDEIVCDKTGRGEIRDYFHEEVIDRGYSIEDAAFVIANCEEEETDRGLWEGLEMDRAMQACAAYSYSNDVWAEVKSQYEGLSDEFEPSWKVVDVTGDVIKEFDDEDTAQEWIDKNDENDMEGYEVTEGRGNIDEIWQDWVNDNTTQAIETGGRDELFALQRWVKLGAEAGLWGGSPLGGVYIDARCGTGYSMPDVKNFYDQDRITRLQLPSMTGKYLDAVKERIVELEGITSAPVTLTVELDGDTEDGIMARLQHISERIGEGDTESYDWKLTKRGDETTRKKYSATVRLEGDQWGEIATGLHGIANQMADGHNEGKGWKLHIRQDGA